MTPLVIAKARSFALEHPIAVVAFAAVAVVVPYLLAGPGFLADDWAWLRNAHFDGWLDAGGVRTDGRPGGALMAALTFGLIGAHPLVLLLLQTALRAVAAVLLYRCVAELVDRRVGLATTLVWIVMGGHSTLELWTTTIAVPIALGLLAAGITEFARACRASVVPDRRHLAVAYALLGGAGLVYELTSVLAGVAVLVVPFIVWRRPRPLVVAAGWLITGAPLLWAAARSSVYDTSTTGWLDPRLVLPGNLSLGLAPFGLQGRLVTGVGIALVLTAAVRLIRPELRPHTGVGERLAVSGLVVLVAGVVPVAHLANNFYGMHDRLTAVSGIGAALLWVGGALMVASVSRRQALVYAVAVVALLGIAIPVRAIRTSQYAKAAREAVQTARELAPKAKSARSMTIAAPVAVVDRVWGLNDGANTSAAVQLLLDDRDVLVEVTG